jgi:hypothetical protein
MWSQHEKYEIEGQIEKEKQNENVISIQWHKQRNVESTRKI